MPIIKSIKCDCETNEWEGTILIQDDGSFEGIIDCFGINIYIDGQFHVDKDSIEFDVVQPESYPYHVDSFHVTRVNNSNRYLGVYTVRNEEEPRLCNIFVTDKELDPEVMECQIKELQFIIKHNVDTLDERYSDDAVRLRETNDPKYAARLEKKLRNQGKMNYYL